MKFVKKNIAITFAQLKIKNIFPIVIYMIILQP